MKKEKSHTSPQTPQAATPIQPLLAAPLTQEEQMSKHAAEIEITKFAKHLWLNRKEINLTVDQHVELTEELIQQRVREHRLAQKEDISKLAEVVFRLSVHLTLSREEAMLQAETMYQRIRNLTWRLGNAVLRANPGIDKQQ